jgi:hypothetical protein
LIEAIRRRPSVRPDLHQGLGFGVAATGGLRGLHNTTPIFLLGNNYCEMDTGLLRMGASLACRSSGRPGPDAAADTDRNLGAADKDEIRLTPEDTFWY